VSLVWNGLPLSYGLYTQGDSDVKTIEDIKGKRVCSFPTTASAHDDMTAMLAYVGLTWDDVTPVPCSGYPDAAHAIIEGRADVAHYTTTAGETYDVAGSPRGIHWIETPASDKEGWARVAETRPFITPALAVRGAGLKEGETFEGYGKPLGLVTGDWTDENLAYWTTKTIAENYDAYKANHEMLLYWTLDQALDVGAFIIPYHSGSIRYFKEIGRWSPELEQLQSKLVAVGEKAIQDYEQANPGWETGRAPLIFEEGKWK